MNWGAQGIDMIMREKWIAQDKLNILNQNANGKDASQQTFIKYFLCIWVCARPGDNKPWRLL